MKKVLMICLLVFPFYVANAQDLNQGFEQLNSLNNGPAKWGPGDYFVLPVDSNCSWTGADSMNFWSWDAHSGDRSYEIRVATYCTSGYSGQLKTRMFAIDTFAEQRVPFSDRPDAFTFCYKFTTIGGDNMNVSVRLEMADGYTVGYGSIALEQSTSGWALATIPMLYADTMMPEFITMHFILQNDTDLHYGTRFVVDDIATEPVTSVAATKKEKAVLLCYPVPAENVLRLILPKPTVQSIGVTVIDAIGRLVMRERLADINSGLDISKLPPGIYSLKLSTAADIFTTRFIK